MQPVCAIPEVDAQSRLTRLALPLGIFIYGLLSTGVTALPFLEMIAKVITIKAHNIWLTTGDETRRKASSSWSAGWKPAR
jgi:hypothetical protein